MKILAIDTSAITATAALLDGEAVKAEISFSGALTHSQTIMPMIDELLSELSLSCKDIDLFACSVGPGSFTGLRIGIGTIKGLAYGADKPVVGISTLEALAQNVFCSPFLISPIMDARRNQVYNALYRFNGQKLVCVEEPRALSVEELAAQLKGKTVFVGDGVKVHREYLQNALGQNAVFAPPHLLLQRAGSVCTCALDKEPMSADKLGAIYLRKPQAEREREEKEQKNKIL